VKKVVAPVKMIKHESGNTTTQLVGLCQTMKDHSAKGAAGREPLLKQCCLDILVATKAAESLETDVYDNLLSALSTMRTHHPTTYARLSPLLLEARLLVEEKLASGSSGPAVIVRQRSFNSVLHPTPPAPSASSSSSKRLSKLVASPSDIDVVGGGLFSKDTICVSSSNDEDDAGSEDGFGFYDVEVEADDDDHIQVGFGPAKPAIAINPASAAAVVGWTSSRTVPRKLRYDAAQLVAEGRQ
jgi:hypothetical protein